MPSNDCLRIHSRNPSFCPILLMMLVSRWAVVCRGHRPWHHQLVTFRRSAAQNGV
jgi:hypothetical protein